MKTKAVLIAFFISFLGISQDADILYKKVWKLLTFDYNGENYQVPSEQNFGLLFINPQDPDNFETFIATNTLTGSLTIDETTRTFAIFDTEATVLGCKQYCELEGAYIDFFLNDGKPHELEYVLSIFYNGSEYDLGIIDSKGNIAVYTDFMLSQEEFKNKKLSLYPNPVSNQLFWEQEIFETLKLYSMQGVLLATQEASKGYAEVSNLAKGVYFIELIKDNKSIFNKFVKQ